MNLAGQLFYVTSLELANFKMNVVNRGVCSMLVCE